MELSKVIKVVAAFVGGVVVALGSALIYVRVNEMAHPEPAVATQASVPVTSQNVSDGDAPSQAPAAEPAPKIHPRKRKASTTLSRHVIVPEASLPNEPSNAPVEVAQNIPAAPPVVTSHPAPAVNDGQYSEPQPQLQASPGQQPQTTYNPPAPAAPQPHVVTLPAGTNLAIRLGETLSTDHNYTGDTFRATLESPIIVDGFIIADRRSKVLGRIVNAEKAGRVEGVSDLTLTLTEINTSDGQRVRIETGAYDKRGPASTGEDTAKIAGGAALGAIIGAMAGGGKGAAIGAGAGGAAGTGTVLATRGKAAVLPTETRLTFRLASPVTITEKLNY